MYPERRDRDHHVLLGDQVLELELLLGGDDLGAAVVALAVERADLRQLLADHAVDPRLVAEQRAQLADALLEILELQLDLLAGETRQAGEPQVENRLRLDLRERELRHQLRAGLVAVLGRADQGDDRVDRCRVRCR